jgi:hypothetical protein
VEIMRNRVVLEEVAVVQLLDVAVVKIAVGQRRNK